MPITTQSETPVRSQFLFGSFVPTTFGFGMLLLLAPQTSVPVGEYTCSLCLARRRILATKRLRLRLCGMFWRHFRAAALHQSIWINMGRFY